MQSEAGPWQVGRYQIVIDCLPRPRLVASLDGRALPELPPAVRAHPDMSWLRLSLEAARAHFRELRTLLENAMVEQVPLAAADLAFLRHDRIGASLLSSLLLDQGGLLGGWLPDDGLLDTLQGELHPCRPPVHVVHPLRLRESQLAEAARWLSRRGLRQPFRQVRRELYRLEPEQHRAASAEPAPEAVARWDQARALLEGRGWGRVTKTRAERTFPRYRMRAFLEFRTPVGPSFSRENVVLGRAYFLPAGREPEDRGRPGLLLERVEPILFSETLRDVYLVAAVARPRG